MITNDQLSAYLDGRLAPTERERLEQELANDEAALKVLVAQERMDALLQVHFASENEHQRVKESILQIVSGPSYPEFRKAVLKAVALQNISEGFFTRMRNQWVAVAAVAACLMLALCFIPRMYLVKEAPHFARLIEVAGQVVIVHQGTEVAAKNGSLLQRGDVIRVEVDSSAVVQLKDRTTLSLEPRTELEIFREYGDRHFNLVSGKLSAHVAKQPAGQPLTIQTPLAIARVLGTQFVLAAAPQLTRVDVKEGLVKVAHPGVDDAVEVAGGEFAVALPRQLVAGVSSSQQNPSDVISSGSSGDRDPAAWPFASDSPWNTPIGAGAIYADMQSPAFDLVRNGASIRPVSHMRPFFVAKASDPRCAVAARYEERILATIPLPAEARPQRDWSNFTVIDSASGAAYELSGAHLENDQLQAVSVTTVSLRGAGIPPEQRGNTFSGLPMIAGVIRAGELDRGIRHALCVSVLHAGLNRNGPNGNAFVWPAKHMPIEEKKLARMGTTGNLCYGALLALPRDLNLAELGIGNSGVVYELARALQDFGAYVTHSIPSGDTNLKLPHIQFLAELPMESDWQALDAAVSKIAPFLKVVANNRRESVGGGGKPCREPAPGLLQGN